MNFTNFKNLQKQIHALLITIYLSFFSTNLHAQAVEDVIIDETETGYEMEIQFFFPMRYQSHTPKQTGRTLEVRLHTESSVELEAFDLDRIDERVSVSWDKASGIPIRDIVFDGEDHVENPSLIVRFLKNVEWSVRSSPDLHSIFISIITEKPRTEPIAESVSIPAPTNLITSLKSMESDLVVRRLLDRANQAMLEKNYSDAAQLFTKLREIGSEAIQPGITEMLGVARENNSQLAHAAAEYKKFLENYPEDEAAPRVRQRLAALITAAQVPKQRATAKQPGKKKSKGEWNTQFFGGFAQRYTRDETLPQEDEDREPLINREDTTTDLDFVMRARKGDLELKTQFIGTYRDDLLDDGENEFIPSIASFSAKHSGSGLYGQIGRQSLHSGGVLGRFDGLHLAYDLNEYLTFNTIAGHPVDTAERNAINTDKEFYGVSIDAGSFWDGWDFNAFYIVQDSYGIDDREAVGGEIRYFDTTKSLFALVDYDISYDDLNIFLLIGNWRILDDTSLNLVIDYRNSPILTTSSAIQGQGVTQLDELFDVYSEDELRDLAEKRTAESKSLTTGITHEFSEKWQLIGELTVTEFGETKASPNVEAIPGTGKEYFYSTQLIANSLVLPDDIMILGARYSDTQRANAYSLSSNWRINKGRTWRINPSIRVDYRENKEDDDSRWLVRPFLRIDYRMKRWFNLELDIGYEWVEETFVGEPQGREGYFVSTGYRAQF